MTEQEKPNFAWLDPKTGVITETSEGVAPFPLHGLAPDADGRYLWATRQNADELIRFDTQTKRFDKTFKLPKGSGPRSLALGPDKRTLWIALQHSAKLGRYNPVTGAFKQYDTPLSAQDTPDPQPAPKLLDIDIGPSGKSIWLTTFFANRLFRFDIAKEELTEPVCGIAPGGSSLGVTRGPDGNMWYSSALSGQIFRVEDSK